MHEEPVILIMPEGFDFDLDASACHYKKNAGLYLNCAPRSTLSSLAELNSDNKLEEIGTAMEVAGLTVDIDIANRHLIIHD